MLPARVVHVHPTRVCNLACAHCYSSSSPAASPSLDISVLGAALRVLRTEGYEVLSISGGEPLVYRDLDLLARSAAELGYRVHVVTNGLLLSKERARALRAYVHLMAVSFDGSEDTHNRVRGRADAFRKANAGLDVLTGAGIPFGLAFGVSSQSLPEVPWAFERAHEVGAHLLHLRPLVPEGRARELPHDWLLSREDLARLVVVGELLGSDPIGLPHVQVDLVRVDGLSGAREQFEFLQMKPGDASLSDAVNPLVITEQGQLLPFTYGVHPRFTITDFSRDWREEIARFSSTGAASIIELLEAAFGAAAGSGDIYLDWFAHLTAVSHVVKTGGMVVPEPQLTAPAPHRLTRRRAASPAGTRRPG